MKRLPALLCVLALFLTVPAIAEEEPLHLIRCEYRVSGGMENESLAYTLSRGAAGSPVLTVEENGKERTVPVPWDTLRDLEAAVIPLRPEGWAALPPAEFFALDAPSHHAALTCADGTEYSLSDSRESAWNSLWLIRSFLESYTVDGAQTFSLSFSSFEGGGPSFTPVFTRPEVISVSSFTQHGEPGEEIAPGSAFTETMVFHGRVPGQTEMRIRASGPLTPLSEGNETYYVLTVDDAYNVTAEEKTAAGPSSMP